MLRVYFREREEGKEVRGRKKWREVFATLTCQAPNLRAYLTTNIKYSQIRRNPAYDLSYILTVEVALPATKPRSLGIKTVFCM